MYKITLSREITTKIMFLIKLCNHLQELYYFFPSDIQNAKYGIIFYNFFLKQLIRHVGSPADDWGPLQHSNRMGTFYEMETGTSDLSPPWKYDPVTQTFIFPESITLTRTPAGSMYNIAKVQNYTGPIPMILNVPDAGGLGLNLPPRKMKQSRSASNLAMLGVQSAKNPASSTPHLNTVGLSSLQQQQKLGHSGSLANIAGKARSSFSHLLKKSPLASREDLASQRSGPGTPLMHRSKKGQNIVLSAGKQIEINVDNDDEESQV